ncbi:MAG TPA: DUF1269 domain-containing protein [Candidatus Angelobacter sp.]|nr:DUF1269 domain-containing protein [Candidatus Angelobacter sp.]
MSHLIALINDQYKGDEARATLHHMVREGLLQIEDCVLVTRNLDGKASVSAESRGGGTAQRAGHLLGLVTAAVTGMFPFPISGTLGGRLVGKLMDHGVTSRFVKTVKTQLTPGSSALIVLGESDPERRQKISERLQGLGARVAESDLPLELREGIEKDLEGQRAA